MIDQMERMNALLDAYEQLLTEKQREILNLYYKEDLSFPRLRRICTSAVRLSTIISSAARIFLRNTKKKSCILCKIMKQEAGFMIK